MDRMMASDHVPMEIRRMIVSEAPALSLTTTVTG
jgi:hypothetical protein